jgi:hypothetical protein
VAAAAAQACERDAVDGAAAMTLCGLTVGVDGRVSGRVHKVALSRYNGFKHADESLGGRVPLMWLSRCGVQVMLFDREGLHRLARDLRECRDCVVGRRPVSPGVRYGSDAERIEARRRTWRESKQRSKAA